MEDLGNIARWSFPNQDGISCNEKFVIGDLDGDYSSLSCNSFSDRVSILAITTKEHLCRKGYATALVENMVKIFGHQNIDWGVCTTFGQLFRDSLYHSHVLEIQPIHLEQEQLWIDFTCRIESFISAIPLEFHKRLALYIVNKEDHKYADVIRLPDEIKKEAFMFIEEEKVLPTRFPQSIFKR